MLAILPDCYFCRARSSERYLSAKIQVRGVDAELQKIASELYGLPLDEFVTRRDALASEKRKEKNKSLADAIKALAKPTLAAWVVNQMVRHQSDVTDLLQLGEQMRQAQETLQGEELRKLSAQRTELLKEMGKQAQALARKLEQPMSEDARDEVVATLSAALADPAVSEQVRSGQLTRSVHYSGFGQPMIPTAEPPKTEPGHQTVAPEPKTKPTSRTERAAEAERKMAAAREALRVAEEEAEAIRKEEEEAARLLENARQEADSAAEAERTATQDYERSKHRVHHLQEQLEAARAELTGTEATLQEAKDNNRRAQQHLRHVEAGH